jgi:Ca2+-binding EF-hand superfamily protein
LLQKNAAEDAALAENAELRAENAALREDLRNARAATVAVPVVAVSAHPAQSAAAQSGSSFANPFADGGGYSEAAALDLATIAGIAGIDVMALDDVLSRFAPFAGAEGCLSRPSFRSAWRALVAEAGVTERAVVLGSVDALFDMFDINGNGLVDMAELGSGLSVLCGGSRDEKARVAFQLYDYDGDGMISLEEMVRYLTPVFTIMFETSAGAHIVGSAGSADVSPAELALATALGAFADAGVHRDGVLSWPQFRRWYLSTGDSATQDAAVASAVDIDALRQLTGLENMSVAGALDLFAESDLSRDPAREISLDVFEECLTSEVDVASLDERSASVLHVTITKIFETFDTDGNGLVSFAELGAGLAMLCGGSGDEKARAAFNLYDINGDGVITLDEMRRYLFSVFSVMLETNLGASAAYGNASELAAMTAAEAFDAAGIPRDGSMTWLQFKEWYSSSHDDDEGATPAEAPPPPPPRRSSARPPPPPSPGSVAVADVAALTGGIDLDEARRLTGLGAVPMSEALLIFNARAAMDGDLSRAAFDDCFNALAPEYEDELTDAEWTARDTIIAKLFTMFDSHRTGSIDVTEISVGLAILCTGAQDEKARAAFDLYDTNGDGVISFDEMVHYLESIFTVMFDANRTSPEVMSGVSVQEFALATAADAFGAIDTDHNGVLSWDEFRAWYGAAAGAGAPIVVTPISANGAPSAASYDRVAAIHEAEAVARGSVRGIDLSEARRLTGLGGVAMRDALAIFSARVAANGELSRAAFEDCFNAEELEVELSGPEWDARDAVISKLFVLFDTHRSGSIDFTELGVGISILCTGAEDEKARAAFDLYDTNGDGVISFDEMVHYLESIFKVMFDANGASHEVMSGASAAEFALATAADAFGEIDTDHNGVLSWDEFRAWYGAATGAEAPLVATAIVGLESGDGLARGGSSQAVYGAASTVAAVPEPFDLGAASRLTGLNALAPALAIELFAHAVDRNGVVTLDNFVACFDTIATAPRARCIGTLTRLFELFDVDGNGVLTHQEVGSGLTVLCGGTRDEKASAAFTLFDEDGNGVISLPEMQQYFISVFTVMLHSGAHPISDGVSVHELAYSTAKQAFTDADTDHDHVLSWEEFRAWYSPPGGAAHADASREAAIVAIDALEPLDVAEASRLTGLGALDPGDALDLFRDALDEAGGVIAFDAFAGCFNEIVDAGALTPADCAKLQQVITQLFDLFDADGNGVVDFTELGSGITVLCGGSRDEKARAAFELFDDNGDGLISLPEMVRYFTSVFTVMYTSGGNHGVPEGVSAEELALETAIQAFAEADTDSSGTLTWDEFKLWYSSSEESSDESGGSVSGGGGAPNPMSGHGSEALDLDAMRRLAGLSSSSVDSALGVFHRAADASGALDRELFSSCFESIVDVGTLSEDDIEELHMTVIPRLFDMFDTDGNGVVDFAELASGLSVLCGGTREDKVRIAFQLYDYDGDGVITFAEMARYLTSVFSVMYETNAEAQANAGGLTARELALATAEEAFAEADPGRTGQLTWEQFSGWFPQEESDGIADVSGGSASRFTLDELSGVTGLGAVTATNAMAIFTSGLTDNAFTHPEFERCFKRIVDIDALDDSGRAQLHDAIDSVFAMFDSNGDGVIDFAELGSGLSVLCGGSKDEKAQAAFKLFDADGDGVISLPEMVQYFTSVFTVRLERRYRSRSPWPFPPRSLSLARARMRACSLNCDRAPSCRTRAPRRARLLHSFISAFLPSIPLNRRSCSRRHLERRSRWMASPLSSWRWRRRRRRLTMQTPTTAACSRGRNSSSGTVRRMMMMRAMATPAAAAAALRIRWT